MCSGPLRDLYSTPGAPNRARFGPERPLWEPRRALSSPGGPDLGPTATGWSNWVGHMAMMLNELTWTYWASISAARAPFGLFGPNSFRFVAPFWVEFHFGPNIGMSGVQSVPMERPAHTALLQSIWNHPAEENGQNVNYGSCGGGGGGAHFAVCLCLCHFCLQP